MVVVLDTGLLPVGERIEAAQDLLADTEVPSINQFEGFAGQLWHRVAVRELGAGVHVTQVFGTGMRVLRDAKQLRVAAPERVGVGVHLTGSSTWSHCGADQILAAGELSLTDGTSTSDLTSPGFNGLKVVIFDYDQLALPIETVRRAAPRLKSSPLYDLVSAHITALGEAGDIEPGPAQIMLKSATTQLIRALITTAAADPRRHEALHDSLYLRIAAYVEQHLGDPGLNPDHIARAHNISVRHLYNIWSARGTTLSQWIINARLEGAYADLARLGRTTSIAAVAGRWGFASPAHFARRFRDAYGMSPRDWQRAN
ncbi:helix-turn-helix domain-containing protein [Nocardia tengchongensis]|uniref:Helix-turn-helix domain-containing protein n=1 Tax=Nocardia tengchongensis TaxID=2055889 RepID=A0ABX8D0L8_9NOCA|nr:helix-turn-helix domain-containing protein [Nocardia tengchongensis]QVI23950.1 helix-turn-helix domain-containing protein [Nocardia tengchongensis]